MARIIVNIPITELKKRLEAEVTIAWIGLYRIRKKIGIGLFRLGSRFMGMEISVREK